MNRTWRICLLVALVVTIVVAATGIAQPTPTDTASAATSQGLARDLLAFFSSRANAVMAGIVAGLLFKFLPAFRNLTNEWIPVVTALMSFLIQAVQPASAQAGFFGDLLRTSAGIMAPVVLASIDSRISKFVNEGWLRGPASVHWKKPLPDRA